MVYKNEKVQGGTMKKYTIYNDVIFKWRSGRMTVEVRSIGHKWVWLKLPNRKQFTKISRAEWDQLAQNQYFKEVV